MVNKSKLTKAQEKRFDKKFGGLFSMVNTLELPSRKQIEDLKSHLANELDLSTERGYWEGRKDEKKEIVEKLEKIKEYIHNKPEPRTVYDCDCGYSYDDCMCEHNNALDQAIKKINE